MKKIKKSWIILSVVIAILGIGTVMILFRITEAMEASRDGAFVFYGESHFSSNGKYSGLINVNKERVSILERSQKEVSGLDIKESHPSQIVLGENSYFLLYREDDDSGDARIVQYNYQSVKKQEYIAQNTDFIDYKDGYLFTGSWIWDEENEEYLKYKDYTFYANYYIKEEDFGEAFEELKPDSSGKCVVGDIELYYHEDGYFGTEPPLADYSELLLGGFRASDDSWEADTERGLKDIKKHRSLLLSEIENVNGVYDVFAYQIENNIYGVCNVFKDGKYIPSLPTEPEDIESAYFYKINPENDEITILLKKDSCIGLVLSGNEAVYQEDNRIMHYDFETGEEEKIYQINNEHDMTISINRDSLMVEEEKKRVLPFIFPTDEEVKSVIQWKVH